MTRAVLSNMPKRELDALRGASRRRWRVFALSSTSAILFLFLALFFTGLDAPPLRDIADDLARSRVEVANNFSGSAHRFLDWLEDYSTSAELYLFERCGAAIGESLLSGSSRGASAEPHFFVQVGRTLHHSLLRILFVVFATWKIWMLAFIAAFLYSRKRMAVHEGRDLLGLTGNGRLFFSGARISLKPIDDRGRPQMFVRGLACPRTAPAAEVRTHALGRVLERFGALNESTLYLAGVVLAYPHLPSHAAARDQIEQFEARFEKVALPLFTVRLLEEVLSRHREYRRGQGVKDQSGERKKLSATDALPKGRIGLERYIEELGRALHRSLTPALRQQIGALEPQVVAAAVLALEAGKVLSMEEEGDRWIRRSLFPHLSARAVLHSAPTLGDDFSAAVRDTIRRALVYASRRSVFAPVRFPVDLTPETVALRQWCELLLALPHEIEIAADEAELHALVSESHAAWRIEFLEGISTPMSTLARNAVATQQGLLLMPLGEILTVLKRAVAPEVLKRIEELQQILHQTRKLVALSAGEGTEEAHIDEMRLESVPDPLTFHQLKELSEQHGAGTEALREWSAARVLLNSFGWLARRVGDCRVPQSGLIFAILPGSDLIPGALITGRERKACVALRGSRLLESLGKSWASSFESVSSVQAVATRDEYDRVLRGEPAVILDDEGGEPSGRSN